MELQGLSQPTNGFDFYVIDLWEHRNLLSIESNRDEEAGHNRQAFVLSLLLTKMSCRYTGVSRNLDRRTRAFCCALRIHVSQSCSTRDRRHLHVSRYSRALCPETDRRFSRSFSAPPTISPKNFSVAADDDQNTAISMCRSSCGQGRRILMRIEIPSHPADFSK